MSGVGEVSLIKRFTVSLLKALGRTDVIQPKPDNLCRKAPSVQLLGTATIHNIYGNPDRICIGEHTVIRGELLTFAHGGDIQLGEYCYLGEHSRIWSAKSIRIGDRVLISHNVSIFDNDTHPIDDPVARHKQFKDIITTGHPKDIDLKEQPVVIEDDVLISCQCVVLKGVTIGRGAVVGAGSIVTEDVPPYTVVAGNPARVIRKIEYSAGGGS